MSAKLLPQTAHSLGHPVPALSQEHVGLNDVLHDLSLPSTASAEGFPPLFGWFTGTMAQSDFSSTYMSAVRFMAFADRP